MLVENFVESWVFSACMNIVNECEPLSVNLAGADPNFIGPFNAVKADLLLTARRQVQHLPHTSNSLFSLSHLYLK